MSVELSLLEQKIGYSFVNKALLVRAFTHSTYAEKRGCESNERMEYLGDAVLELVVSKKQYVSGTQREGEMTKARQRIVSQGALFAVSERLELKKYLRFIGSDANVGEKTVASLYETLVAAIYLDGGFDRAEEFVLKFYPTAADEENYIGELQEYFQKRGKPAPVYKHEKTGEDHDPTFLVWVEGYETAPRGIGKSLSKAKRQAAKNLLNIIIEKKE